MVYDLQGSYIGDKHKSQDEEMDEGEELRLDNGVVIEVGEKMTTTVTDISELFKRNSNASPKDPHSDTARTRLPSATKTPTKMNTFQPKHKSLHALLGPRRGAYGKALLPTKSPYQLRQEGGENKVQDNVQPNKRQRLEGTASIANKTFASRRQSSDACTSLGIQATAQVPRWKNCSVDLTSDEIHSDVTIPPTPPAQSQASKLDTAIQTSASSFKTGLSKISKVAQGIREPSGPTDEVSDPSKASKAALPPALTLTSGDSSIQSKPSTLSVQEYTKKPTQYRPLRIAKAAPRKMLICLDEQPRRISQVAVGTRVLADDVTARTARTSLSNDHESNLSKASKKAQKRKSVLDVDDELDAIERGDISISSIEAAAPIKRSNSDSLQRAGSLGIAESRNNEAMQETRFQKTSRRSPLKKNKSLSTTDAGNDRMAKKSRSSKTGSLDREQFSAEPARSLKRVTVEPWSVEAFDLFDWRPPEIETNTTKAVVAVA